MVDTRWTITRSAGALHRQVLRDHGYIRRGTRCRRTDFLERLVFFSAARWFEPEDRRLQVGATLGWIGLPEPHGPDAIRHTSICVNLRSDLFLQPLASEHDLSPELVRLVGDVVLPFLEAVRTPEEFIDRLLAPRSLDHPELVAVQGDCVYHMCAAWGAALLGDPERCRTAIGLAHVDARTEDGSVGDERFTQRLHEEVADLDGIWRRLHGRPRPA